MNIQSVNRATSAIVASPVKTAASQVETTQNPTDGVVLSRDTPYVAKPVALPSASELTVASSKALLRTQDELAVKVASSSTPLFGVGGRLFPDSHGKIEHLALQMGNVEFGKPLPSETREALLNVWGTLMHNMDPHTQFSIVCADQAAVDCVQNLVQGTRIEESRVDVVPASTKDGMSIWIRDSMLPTQDADGRTKILIQDRTYWPGAEDNKVAPLLVEAHKSHIFSQPHTALRIDGGNVLSNRNVSLIGIDSFNQMKERLGELAKDPENLKQMEDLYKKCVGHPVRDQEHFWNMLPKLVLASEFQRPVMVIGTDNPSTPNVETQPAFHIDMCVTPIGDKKFLVGDPRMALDVFNKMSPEERAQVNEEMIKAGTLKEGDDLIGRLCETNSAPDYIANYDRVATELKDAGYEIERVPSMIGLRTTWSLPYLTYNNCMMEIYNNEAGETVKNVYLPQYGCKPLDEMATKTYEKNGYHVVPLQMSAISKLEGAIRCSSYALERDLKNTPAN